MKHSEIQDKLFFLQDPELPETERAEILMHIQSCESCRGTSSRWKSVQLQFQKQELPQYSERFVRKVMDRLEALENPPAPVYSPAPSRGIFARMLPVFGYGLAFFLMFLAISYRESATGHESPVNIEDVLLSDVPQSSKWTFSAEPPDTNNLLPTQEEEL